MTEYPDAEMHEIAGALFAPHPDDAPRATISPRRDDGVRAIARHVFNPPESTMPLRMTVHLKGNTNE